MNDEKIRMLFCLLFPTEEIRIFLCNDLFEELKNIVPYQICISSYNSIKKVREAHHTLVRDRITNFLENNNDYMDKIKQIYVNIGLEDIVNDLILAYVFYISQINKSYNNIDILEDKKSICYHTI